MADLLLTRLQDTDLAFPIGPLTFSSLVAADLGNAATPDDGFDYMFNGVMAEIPNDESIGPALDQHLADMDYAPGAFRGSTYDPLLHSVPGIQAGGDYWQGKLDKGLKIDPFAQTAQQRAASTPAPPRYTPTRAPGRPMP